MSEFGHPDVAILLTCLAFYYSGLNISQFQEGLRLVLKSDDPATEYDKWTHGTDALPETLQHWNVINCDDQGQTEDLWWHLRFNRSVLDYYMNKLVFPVHAKQFAVKLQASGWDIPLTPQMDSDGEISPVRTTGFSGTNDNKALLPFNIKQDDLPSLCQTNAEVLTYLLQDRNRKYCLAADQGKRLTEEGLLRQIAAMGIRILIDAGAYILEMDNQSLVKTWLDYDPKAKGALYFGADNRAWIQYRAGKAIPLLATPFAESLDECLVYIDEAHTRGIDLKLPRECTGALTLALGQTKDHTVQAAMRLRKLGATQSIVFFAPPEVNQNIMDVIKERRGVGVDAAHLNSSHVVTWLLEQTCSTNGHLQTLYLAQGADYCRRMDAQLQNRNFLTVARDRQAYLERHPERRTLEQLYGSTTNSELWNPTELASTELRSFMEELGRRRRAVGKDGTVPHSSALDEVEQEREVEFQIEEVRQVQKRTHYKALTFPGLSPSISSFVETGVLVGESGYEHVFMALARTGVGKKYGIKPTSSRLFASTEFMRTIKSVEDLNDDFLRPVEWILWNPSNETGIIVISEEAELLIEIIRSIKSPTVHLITYAAPVTKAMLHFNSLTYYALPRLPRCYTVPQWFAIELGIVAGRLYIDFVEYTPIMEFLRLIENDSKAFANKPASALSVEDRISFAREWLTLCRKGQEIMHTPMGYVCNGRQLRRTHPFFLTTCDHVRETGGTWERHKGSRGADDIDTDEDGELDIEQ